MFRKITAILLTLVLLAACGCCFTEDAKAETAREAVSSMGLGWNLGNTFDATGDWIMTSTNKSVRAFETAWGNPVTPDTLMKKLKTLGFDSVRIPITWHYHFKADGTVNTVWLDRIQEIVDQALDADLYVIINVHHDTGADGWLRATRANYEENSAVYARIWKDVAERFVDYPDKLLFEGFNEMLDDKNEWNNPSAEAGEVINAYNQLFVDTVRATGGRNAERNLVCCTYAAANTDTALKAFRLPEDTIEGHLIAEIHFYTPYEFVTDTGITWTTPKSKYDSYIENSVDQVFDRLKNTFGDTPLIIGEFGTEDKNNTEDRIKWYTRVVTDAKAMDAACFIWDNGIRKEFMLVDRVGDDDNFPEILEACVKAVKEP